MATVEIVLFAPRLPVAQAVSQWMGGATPG